MKRRSPPPRSRPAEDTAEPPALAVSFPHARIDLESAPEPIQSAEPAHDDARQDWRERLAALTDAGALTMAQEADCFRLFETQEAETRETMPHLLAELKPHFDTENEMQAKQRFIEALQAMKHKQLEEVSRLLASFGLEPPQPPT